MEILEDLSLEWVLVILIITTLLTLLLYLGYSGLFTSITVCTTEPDTGPMTLAYKTMTGPYKDAGELFTESYCLLPHREQLGIYYDDPEAVPASELRCAVGPVLAKGEEEEPIPEEMEKMRENGFKIVHLPKPSYVVTASFPFTTTISIYLGIYRVYPRLRDYIAERKLCAYPALEMYNDANIMFMMPLSRQDEFFVSEFQEDEMSIATTTDVTDVTDRSSFMLPHVYREKRDESRDVRDVDLDVKEEDSKNIEDEEIVDVTKEDDSALHEKREDSSEILAGALVRD